MRTGTEARAAPHSASFAYDISAPSTSSGTSTPRDGSGSKADVKPFSITSASGAARDHKTPAEDALENLELGDEQDHLLTVTDCAPRVARPSSSLPGGEVEAASGKEEPVTWRSLPRKDQLILLTLTRMSEPLTQTSLQAYMFYQLKSFDPSLSDSTISSQVGLLQGSFTAAQFLTAIPWGRAADSELFGRKLVLLIGLLGTAVSAVGFGFSRSFAVAVCFRCLGGALNGNIGVMRTMIAEIIKEKKYQSRAFMILPMTFNIGVIIGPILGGLLADPVGSYPNAFGPGSLLGGKNGVSWMVKWPYALPNLVSAIFLVISSLAVILGLEETHDVLRQRTDYGLELGRWLAERVFCRRQSSAYAALPGDDVDQIELRTTSNGPETADVHAVTTTSNKDRSIPTTTSGKIPSKPQSKRRLPFRRIWTRNVLFTLLAHGLLAMHVGTFNNLWFVFLSTPRFDPKHSNPPTQGRQRLPIHFTGGLGLPPARIGLALSILGFIGIALQLLLYPRMSARLGTTTSYRLSLLLFPVAYVLCPFLAIIPSTTKPPVPAAGLKVWFGITVVLFVQVLARTFALPATTILVNSCCPHPSVLGTIHGIGQSVSSGMRTIGPVLGGWAFGWGLKVGVVGTAFWGMACVAVAGVFAGTFVRDGSGHEIYLEGEEEE